MIRGRKLTYLAVLGVLLIVGGFYLSRNSSEMPMENSDKSIEEIISKGKLVVGTSPPYGPMEFIDESGEIVGIDVDIAREIANSMEVELDLKDIEFDTLVNSINRDEVDLFIAAITITAEKSEEVLFSAPYFNGGQTLVKKSSSGELKSIMDLENRSVGVEDDGSSLKDEIYNPVENPLVKLYKESENISYSSKVVEDLNNGEIEAFVIDYVAAADIVRENEGLEILGEPFTQEFYGIAAKKGNEALINKVNDVLRELKASGKLDEIQNKWINN